MFRCEHERIKVIYETEDEICHGCSDRSQITHSPAGLLCCNHIIKTKLLSATMEFGDAVY